MKYIIVLILLLTGCASEPREKIIFGPPKFISPVIIHPAPPKAVKLTPPTFTIITDDNASAVFSRNAGPYFAVTADGYENLSRNVQELRRYILELQQQVLFYKKSIEDYEKYSTETSNEANRKSD